LNPTSRRLAELDAVANAYLSIFQVLGGLGVLLGAVGGGVVAARNVVDRRGELALLQATGWNWSQVRRLLLSEHCLQIFLGIAVGGICACLTTVPRLEIQGEPVAWMPMLVWLFVLASTSLLSVGIALRLATPKHLLEALRSE
jgi:ABC-type lipoprotein release transport system permease subunit